MSKNYQSPLTQFKSGIASKDVKCMQGLQLFIKTNDGSPACVKPQTAQKFVERGWGRLDTTTCPTGKTIVNGQYVTSIPATAQTCNGDTSIPYSYALPCIHPLHMS